jgi:ABC-type bacteriocin/lantibiotic exporter with double-glycine peptidase domain
MIISELRSVVPEVLLVLQHNAAEYGAICLAMVLGFHGAHAPLDELLYLAEREGRRTAHGTQLAGRFRQGDLADLLGATTRSIITILNAWRADGLVIYDPAWAQLTLCRELELQRLVGAVSE